jgi:hypothetical protein
MAAAGTAATSRLVSRSNMLVLPVVRDKVTGLNQRLTSHSPRIFALPTGWASSSFGYISPPDVASFHPERRDEADSAKEERTRKAVDSDKILVEYDKNSVFICYGVA